MDLLSVEERQLPFPRHRQAVGTMLIIRLRLQGQISDWWHRRCRPSSRAQSAPRSSPAWSTSRSTCRTTSREGWRGQCYPSRRNRNSIRNHKLRSRTLRRRRILMMMMRKWTRASLPPRSTSVTSVTRHSRYQPG